MAAIAFLGLFLHPDQTIPTAAVLDVGPWRNPLLHQGTVRGRGLGVCRTAFGPVHRRTRHRMKGGREGWKRLGCPQIPTAGGAYWPGQEAATRCTESPSSTAWVRLANTVRSATDTTTPPARPKAPAATDTPSASASQAATV